MRQKAFSDNPEQREFNSKAQKLLRGKHDVQTGLKKIKELNQSFNPELVGKETIENARRYGREINKTPSSTSAINPSSIHEKISRKGRIRSFQKKELLTDIQQIIWSKILFHQVFPVEFVTEV